MPNITRGEARSRVEYAIASNDGHPGTLCMQIMAIIDEIVEELDSRGSASDEDEADATRRLSALSDPENVQLELLEDND